MIYPAQTSLMPVQVALARFLEQGGPSASSGLYPYWYLGTTPFRYLTGPILPIFAGGLHKILPFLSLFEIMLGLVGIAWVIGGVGVYWLVYSLHHPRSPFGPPRRCFTALLAALFYAFGPIVPFLFRFSDVLYLIAFSFLPFVYAKYAKFLRRERRENDILLCLLITFVILLDSLIIPTLVLGMAAIFLAEVGWKKAEEKLKQTLLVLSSSFLVATLWYTPGYWWTLLGAPSLAGKGLAGVMLWLGKLLPTALAFGIAIFSIKFFKKKNLLRDFCFYWLFIFGFLTLLRFISDPDFWLDWTAYGIEIQFGVGIALGLVISQLFEKNQRLKIKDKKHKLKYAKIFMFLICVFSIWFLVFSFTFNKYVLWTLQKDITQTVEYKIGKQLSQIAKPQDRVFLSGTTAFWLNAFFDIPQVRGGVDQASVDPNWRRAAWEIREGTEVEKSLEWLKEMGVSYLVVHTADSAEFYHDFTYPDKFEGVPSLKKIYDEAGDRIYRVLD